jgi:hypothetical protein
MKDQHYTATFPAQLHFGLTNDVRIRGSFGHYFDDNLDYDYCSSSKWKPITAALESSTPGESKFRLKI